jgi:hypothetical protein
MTTAFWRLTVEEIALLLSLRGEPTLAQDLLRAQLGAMSQENVEGRLYAAGHALISRGELAVAADGSIHVGEQMARLTDILLDAPCSLRFTRSYRNAELLLTYHFYQGAIYEHRLVQGVVHEIEAVAGVDAVVTGGLVFFGLTVQAGGAADTQPSPVEIGADTWNQLMAQQEYPALRQMMRGVAALNGRGEWLAKDLISADYRGTVLWITYTADKQPVSDHGFLLLKAPERTWLVEPKRTETGESVALQLGSASLFTEKVKELCQLA